MAIASVGYDGTVDEEAWAQMAPTLGTSERVVSGMAATTLASPDRGVQIAAGVAAGHGVHDVVDAAEVVECASTTGTRWDTIVLRRDWTLPTGATTVEVVQGNTQPVIAAAIEATPGQTDDQPLYLAKVQSGSSVVTQLIDLRVRSSTVLSVATLTALPDPPVGTVALADGVIYSRALDGGGSPTWAGLAQQSTFPLSTNWTARAAGEAPYMVRHADGGVTCHGAARRDGPDITLDVGSGVYVSEVIPAALRPKHRCYFTVDCNTDEQISVFYDQSEARFRIRARRTEVDFRDGRWFSLAGIRWQS